MEQQIEIFKTKDNQTEVKVRFEQDTVWLDAHTIASLFTVNRPAIVKHIQKLKDNIKLLNQKSEQNKILALEEFEKEVFNEDK